MKRILLPVLLCASFALASAQIPVQLGSKPWIFILCKFAGNDSEPTTIARYESLLSEEYPGLGHYFREISQNQMNLFGSRVIGWYTLPRTQPEYLTSGRFDLTKALNDAVAVTDKDVYFPNYYGIALVFNDFLAPAEPAAYRKTMGYGEPVQARIDGISRRWGVTWLPAEHRHTVFGHETNTLHHTQAHEIGHALGLPHSSGAYGDTYDNFWDLMSYYGAGSISHPDFGLLAIHPIAYHKHLLGWLSPEQKLTVSPGEQKTVELVCGSLDFPGVKMIRVSFPGSPGLFYTIESRKQSGYDANLTGEAVIIHDVDPNRSEITKNGFVSDWRPAHVVDPDRNGYTGDEGTMWRPGEVFSDVERGIYVLIGDKTENGYQVTVSNNVQGFSDFVSGGGMSSTLVLVNPSSSHPVEGNARMISSAGEPLSAVVNGAAASGEFEISVEPDGVGLFSTNPAGALQLGSLALGSSSPLAASLLFEGPAGAAAVPGQTVPRTSALLPSLPGSTGLRSGVAISNPRSEPSALTLRLHSREGGVISGAEATMTIGPNAQTAAYLDELLTGISIPDVGTLEIAASAPFYALSLLTGPGFFATLPVPSMSPGIGPGRTGTVSTFSGQAGVSGSQDGPRETATFFSPRDLAVGPDGTLYISDAGNQVIRKITADGTVSTVAGQKGIEGSKDGPSLEAQFSWPHGLCVDPSGNIFVADSFNYAIRKISPDGQVTTIAGQLGSQGSNDGVGNEARFKRPRGIALDGAGNLYVSDQANFTIRKITPGGVVTTIAGQAGKSGYQDGPGDQALFRLPWFLDVDSEGAVYVADQDNCAIRRVGTDGKVTTVAGKPGNHGFYDARPEESLFGWPTGVASGPAGRIYIADRYLVRELTPGKEVRSVAGYAKVYSTPNSPPEGTDDGVGIAARFNSLYGLAVTPAGVIYAADVNSHTIRRIDLRDDVHTMQFPHLADGGGLSSTLILMNHSTEEATGNILLFNEDGGPLTGVLNGQAVPGTMAFSIPPKGIRLFTTSGSGAVTSGSVSLESNVPLAGTLLYSSPLGVAAVPSSPVGRRLKLPVETRQSRGARTAAALVNSSEIPAAVALRLLNQNGVVIAEMPLDLPAHGHVAKFCDEFFEQVSVWQSGFTGSLEIVGPGAICAVGLRITSTELATLPSFVEP